MENRAKKVEIVPDVALKRGEARRILILKSKPRLVSVQHLDVLGHLVDFSGHVFPLPRCSSDLARTSLQSTTLEEKTTGETVSGPLLTM